MKVGGIEKESLVDGIGIRFTIFMTGCSHNCDGCHNPEQQIYENGWDYDEEDLIEMIREHKDWITGITLSGGDPLFQRDSLKKFLHLLRKDSELKNSDVWVYTGYLYENIGKDLTQYVDVFVDGRYDKNRELMIFAGSDNQRYFKRIRGTNKFQEMKESELSEQYRVI